MDFFPPTSLQYCSILTLLSDPEEFCVEVRGGPVPSAHVLILSKYFVRKNRSTLQICDVPANIWLVRQIITTNINVMLLL